MQISYRPSDERSPLGVPARNKSCALQRLGFAFPSCVSRGAITLVELLVVLSIIGLLLGLLLPAVQAARERARIANCQSNLRQIGLALHSFEGAHKKFPGGGWGYQWQGFSDIGGPLGQPGAWTFSLLPFLEQEALYKLGRYQTNAVTRDRELRDRLATPLGIYNCPTRRSAAVYDIDCVSCSSPIGIVGSLTQVARGDYAINVGDGAPDMSQLNSWPLDFWGPADLSEARERTRLGKWPHRPSDWTGISYLRSSLRLSEITDGQSNTIAVGEKYIDSLAYESGKDWGDNESLFAGFNNDNHRSTHPHWTYMRDRPGVMSIGSFGSAHASGNFLMCDGSVKAVAYSIDSNLFRNLGNRRDGKTAEVPE